MTSATRAPLMRTSVTTFDSRARERFHTLAYHARFHARTPAEAHEIDRVVTAVRLGALCAREGHAALSTLRRDQQQAA
jgi:hypothetical protein